jgi:hypothetical protein
VQHTQLTWSKFELPLLSPREKVLCKCLSVPLRASNLAYGSVVLGANKAKANTEDMAPDFGL